MAIIQGTSEDDIPLFGTDGDDTISGLAGNDELDGGAGNDLVDGGEGADLLAGSDGVDTILGGAGDDTINGYDSSDEGDVIDGGDGQDEFSVNSDAGMVVDLEAGTTSSGATLISIEDVWGDGGADTLIGGAGANHLRGYFGDDSIDGAAGADRLDGDDGNDLIFGGADDDTLDGGAGDDTLDGGDGSDVAVFSSDRSGFDISFGEDAGGAYTLVTDTNPDDGNDGTDRVYNVETLQFADQSTPICFMPGTLIATPGGAAPVESLQRGDLVLAADGGSAPVVWMGRQTVSRRFADPVRVLPVRIAAGVFGPGLPQRDLLVSPDHALLLDGVLIHAGALVDGGAIRREAAVPESWTYWHVELADHALVLAEGVAAETFIDNADRRAFDNWAEYEALDLERGSVPEMSYPRAKARRQVPQRLRDRLAAASPRPAAVA